MSIMNHSGSAASRRVRPTLDRAVEERLRRLEERWNPLIDARAREQLVEDVRSLVRDQLRRVQRTLALGAGDSERIRNLTERIAAGKAFAQIRRKGDFQDYVELYLTELLRSAGPRQAQTRRPR